MESNRILLLSCLILAVCSGCGSNSDLRVVTTGHQSDAVALWVSNHSMHSRAKRPRILEAKVFFDGAESEVTPQIEVLNSKYGWSEHASFTADSPAETAEIVAVVESNGRTYTVKQCWSSVQNPGMTGSSWVPGRSSIIKRDRQGKGK